MNSVTVKSPVDEARSAFDAVAARAGKAQARVVALTEVAALNRAALDVAEDEAPAARLVIQSEADLAEAALAANSLLHKKETASQALRAAELLALQSQEPAAAAAASAAGQSAFDVVARVAAELAGRLAAFDAAHAALSALQSSIEKAGGKLAVNNRDEEDPRVAVKLRIVRDGRDIAPLATAQALHLFAGQRQARAAVRAAHARDRELARARSAEEAAIRGELGPEAQEEALAARRQRMALQGGGKLSYSPSWMAIAAGSPKNTLAGVAADANALRRSGLTLPEKD